ncbi:MAG TPA: hypothetical protein VI756_21170 [Blastocatellia bacterium]
MSTRPETWTYKLAETTREAYAKLIPGEPLGLGDPRYVRLDRVRGDINIAESLRIKIQAQEELDYPNGERAPGPDPTFARLLLTGHPGCGKTTELLRLKELLEVEDGFTVVYYDAEDQFDLAGADVSWWNVILETIWQLDDLAAAAGVKIPDGPKNEAAEWIARVVTRKQTKKEIEGSVETELGADVRLPFFAGVKALIRSAVKLGSTLTKEVETEADRHPKILVEALTEIVRSVNEQLHSKGGSGLVIIVDGLEKMPLRGRDGGITSHSAMFIFNGDKLASPPCHLLYTLPLALLGNSPVAQIFPDETMVMPVVHVIDRAGDPDDQGITGMTDLLLKRVDPGLVEEGVSRTLALASGGHVRDFVRLARAAASRFGETITTEHAGRAVQDMIGYYDFLYAARYHDALVSVHRDRQLPRGEFDNELIEKLLVLPYKNTQNWYALHPCVLDGPRGLKAPAGRSPRGRSGTQAKSPAGSKRGKSKAKPR